MPLYIRRLPGTAATIVDTKTIPQNEVLFNPSFSDPILYLRGTHHDPIKETNFALLFDTKTKQHRTVDSPMDQLAPTVNLFQGIEDLRICMFQGRLWFTGTTTHASNKMTNELIVGFFSATLDRVEKVFPVDIGSLPVKNVCPFVWKEKLHLLDTFLRAIYEIQELRDTDDRLTGFHAKKVRTLQPAAGVTQELYRGSTSPVHLHGSTWGCVVHDIIFNDNTKLVTRLSYLHHWMEFDMESGRITFVSTPFWVAHWGIEYVSGIQYDPVTHVVELYLGVSDRSPLSFRTTLHDLRIGK